MESKEITVVGLGYIGLPTAVVMAGAGHHVKGFDAPYPHFALDTAINPTFNPLRLKWAPVKCWYR